MTLTKTLSRDKIELPGKNASYLLDVFVKNGGKIFADELKPKDKEKNPKGRGIIDGSRKSFSVWLEKMEQKHWIIKENGPDYKYTRYYAGPKLVDFVNKEKISVKEIATKQEIHDVADETAREFDEKLNKVE
jgi:hypothetical protein